MVSHSNAQDADEPLAEINITPLVDVICTGRDSSGHGANADRIAADQSSKAARNGVGRRVTSQDFAPPHDPNSAG